MPHLINVTACRRSTFQQRGAPSHRSRWIELSSLGVLSGPELCGNCVGKEVDEGLGREKKKCTHPEGYVLKAGGEVDALFKLGLSLNAV